MRRCVFSQLALYPERQLSEVDFQEAHKQLPNPCLSAPQQLLPPHVSLAVVAASSLKRFQRAPKLLNLSQCVGSESGVQALRKKAAGAA